MFLFLFFETDAFRKNDKPGAPVSIALGEGKSWDYDSLYIPCLWSKIVWVGAKKFNNTILDKYLISRGLI